MRSRIIHHGEDELLIQRDSVPDGQTTSSVQDGTQHTHPLSSFLPDLIDVGRPGEPCISQITSCRPIGLAPRKVLLVGAG